MKDQGTILNSELSFFSVLARNHHEKTAVFKGKNLDKV